MNNLWTFGDSLTAPFNESNTWSNKYISWKGYKPDCFELVGYRSHEKIKAPLSN